jgi:PAS domain S-box-containing protein
MNKNISKANQLLLDLKKPHLIYMHTLDQMNEGVAIISHERKYLYVNESYASQMQIRSADLIGHSIFELEIDEESHKYFNDLCQKVIDERIILEAETQYNFKNGSLRWLLLNITPIPEGIFIQSSEITSKKLAYKELLVRLEDSELKHIDLEVVVDSIPDAVLLGNHDGIFMCNKRALLMFGVDSIEDLKMNYSKFIKKFNFRWAATYKVIEYDELLMIRGLNGEVVEGEEVIRNAKNGEDTIVRLINGPILKNGNIIGAVTIHSDISERKKMEYMLKASLKEKEVLLHELYHRTKNNIQIISSLLSLKSNAITDKDARNILDDMNNRIKTIGTIHEMLQNSSNKSEINLANYIKQIVTLILKSYNDQSERISIKLELEDTYTQIDTAISCGIVVNELITNSIKYAFPDNSRGEIHVNLSSQKDIIHLRVSDNGIGLKGKSTSEGSLGLKIFQLIAENQLNAETNIEVQNGVVVTLSFKDIRHNLEVAQ